MQSLFDAQIEQVQVAAKLVSGTVSKEVVNTLLNCF